MKNKQDMMLLVTHPSEMMKVFISLRGNALVHMYKKEKTKNKTTIKRGS